MRKVIAMLDLLSVIALGSVAQAADCCKPGGDCWRLTAPCYKK